MRAFRLAYDGRPYSGFQRQPDVPTVEDVLFDALRDLGVLDGAKPSGYAAAGRTDAGVSALAQTVAFEAPEWLTPAALNGDLPGSIRAWASADVPDDFHATLDATRRIYRYHCYAPDCDDERVREALEALAGEHDFHNLTTDTEGTVRELETQYVRDGDFLVLTFAADGFVRHMVRRIVALVQAVGSGASDLDRVERVLGPDPLDGGEGVPTAPATPLVLAAVTYPDLTFDPDPDAVASAREAFGERRVEAQTAARVVDDLWRGVE
ncbi:tRNA pseudouridine(38-40) synthase TruA [Haloplanus aerogenes]|uniref:tRNA pseudouridine synthase A n=1 Tax=Haloplanus aerogenes TaxID=660522 RepID=A0A3G8QSS2_9EURY|nr:tRNA pseudouridine(38-40) synthase TruA [Haloplanus aerogenes]AZH24479.1 tRNA pseudouridine(38-40) synthase TruA [Haloplanus aerogenes]RMB23873.1 tRNA pseudouridine(38-40) synthase [Haloplanus aerogenes]